MKTVGIVRKVDDLGRVCLPKEARVMTGIDCGEPIEIFVDEGGAIVLRPYSPLGDREQKMITATVDYIRQYSPEYEVTAFLDTETPRGVIPILSELAAMVNVVRDRKMFTSTLGHRLWGAPIMVDSRVYCVIIIRNLGDDPISEGTVCLFRNSTDLLEKLLGI